MPRLYGIEAAKVLIELLDYAEDQTVREVFAYLLVEFSGDPKLSLSPEKHGLMTSFGVYRASDWVYSLKPAKSWVTAWVRPPELRLYPRKAAEFAAAFPDLMQPTSGALTIQLATFDQAAVFLALTKN